VEQKSPRHAGRDSDTPAAPAARADAVAKLGRHSVQPFAHNHPWCALPVGILPPPRDRRDLRFNADRKRRSLDLLRAGVFTRDAFVASRKRSSLRSGCC